jgi:hypothetical protein
MKSAYDFVNLSNQTIARGFSSPLLVLKRELSGEAILGVEGNADPREQKSIQSTATFRPPSADPKIIFREFAKNAERACAHARALYLLSNKISFFVKTSEFKYRLDEAKLSLFTADPGEILNAIEPKLPMLLRKREKIRSTGVILHALVREEDIPLDLFGAQEGSLKKQKVEEAADQIRAKYGRRAIRRAASLRGK